MTAALSLMIASELVVRSLQVAPASLDKPVRIEVPAGQSTRVVLPEAAVGVKYSPGAREHLGLRLVAVRPLGIVCFLPPRHPSKGTIAFRGTSLHVVFAVETVERGQGSEIHLTLAPDGPAPAREKIPKAWEPEPAKDSASRPGPPEAAQATDVREGGASLSVIDPVSEAGGSGEPPAPAEALPSAMPLVSEAAPLGRSPSMDLSAFLAAEAKRIDRSEGLAGQRRCTLAYLYVPKAQADTRLWLKFFLSKGGLDHLDAVEASWGEVGEVVANPVDKDLMVLLQVTSPEIHQKRAWVELRFARAGRYRFTSITSPSVESSFKSLLGVGH